MSYLKVDNLEFVKNVINNLTLVKTEFFKIFNGINYSKKPQSVTPTNEILYTGKIYTIAFKIDENLFDLKEKNFFQKKKDIFLENIESRKNNSPFHKIIIEKYPCIRQLFYNIMEPKSKINPHYGVNGISNNKVPDHFRVHITIESGSDAYFFIENEKPIHYVENLCFGFEDGLVNHWAENRGSDRRIVMIFDVDKKELTNYTPLVK